MAPFDVNAERGVAGHTLALIMVRHKTKGMLQAFAMVSNGADPKKAWVACKKPTTWNGTSCASSRQTVRRMPMCSSLRYDSSSSSVSSSSSSRRPPAVPRGTRMAATARQGRAAAVRAQRHISSHALDCRSDGCAIAQPRSGHI